MQYSNRTNRQQATKARTHTFVLLQEGISPLRKRSVDTPDKLFLGIYIMMNFEKSTNIKMIISVF